ncbi:MAG: FkbM family methyltransferase [Roseovarius sp.]|nr:FkbM family methyltransferase [Roseovarius sp.]
MAAPDLPVIELGGSYGIVSHTIRKHLDDDARLIVLEANPDLVDICKDNVAKAGGKTEVVQAALAYGRDKVRFTVTSGLHTSHVTTGAGAADDAGSREIEVPAMTLATLLADKGIDGSYGLVCDIEGGEFDLFLNDAEALARCAMAIVELHPDPFVRRGESTSAFLEHVRAAGFEIVEVMANVIAARRIT